MDFRRVPGKFAYTGMDIHHPPDLLPDGRCSLLFNLQPDTQTGALTTRPAIASLATTAADVPIHSICRMNDSTPEASSNPFSRFVGAGTVLYSGAGGSLSSLDTGFSGNPLAMVPYRPPQSPEPWLYVFDSAKQQRYKTDNSTKQNIGIAAPISEPSSARIKPLYKIFSNTEAGENAWAGLYGTGGTIGSLLSAVARIPSGATAPVILYDSGSTGMACIEASASNYGWMTASSMVIVGGENVVIEQAFPAMVSTGTTVAAIQYDSGSSGLCTIVPATPLPGVARNQLLLLGSGPTPVRVLSVTAAPDGSYSFRCNTGGTTISAAAAITSPPNFRAWTTSNHAGGVALTGDCVTATLTPTVANGSMSAVMAGATGPVTSSLDLTNVGGRPIQNEDYLHVSLWFDNPQWVTEVHLMLDVDAADADFQHNYYYYVLRQSDFAQSALGGATPGTLPTVSAQLSAVEYGIASQLTSEEIVPVAPQPAYPIPENPSTASPDPAEFNIGQSNWTDVLIKINDLTRVGTDPSLGLSYVNAIGILIYVNGGTVNASVGGCWVGGGYGPDCNFNTYGNQDPEIQWRYRYRNSSTGAHSTVSPETRNGEILRRQGINLTAAASSDAQVDYVDWERRGGSNPDWHYVGSQPVALSYTFTDTVTEAAAQIGDPLEVTSYQPWPVTDVPHSGTALVVGTSVVYESGDEFNLRWLRGTEIIIGGNTYSLFQPPTSDTTLTLAQSVPGTPGTIAFSIPEATIEGQPLYAGWLDEANNRICAVGDPLNPGLMYFSNNDNPDGASDSGYIEVTTPSEPLLNGFYAEGSNYVFTSSSLYRVESTPGQTNPYTSYRLAGVDGIAGPWAFDAQRFMLFWWGPDGIYMYNFGAQAVNITAPDLYPLFPHSGQSGQQGIPGVPVSIGGQTIYPPDYTEITSLRVAYSESFVYCSYLNSALLSNYNETLVFSLDSKGWRKDTYSPDVTNFLLERGVPNPLLLAGGSDGNLYQVSSTATADAGGAIAWAVLPPARDAGDSRANKQWGDLLLDYSTATNTNAPTLAVFWDDLLVAGPTPAVALSSSRTQKVLDLITPPQTSDTAIIHRNVTPLITGTGPIWLYEWQPSYLPLPENTTARVGDWQTGGQPGYKWINGVVIHMDTGNVAKSFKIEYDNQVSTAAIAVQHNGEQRLPYYFAPIYAHEVRLVPQDDVVCRDWHDEAWIFNPEPEYGGALAVNWVDGGQEGYKWINGIILHADTYNDAKVIQVQFDGDSGPTTNITIQHNGEETLPYYFTPVYAHEMRIVPQDEVVWRYWPDTAWMFNMEPEYGGALAVNWVDGGTPHYKFVQGIRLHADTFGQNKQIQIMYEGGIAGPVLTINHNGEETLPYSWTPPFKAHLMYIKPLDNVPWRYWPDTQWVYEIEPEPANYWITQPTAMGQQGYLHTREMWLAFAGATAGGVISVIVDGKLTALATLPAAASPVKKYFPLPPLKGLYWQLTGSGTGLQFYEKDIEFLVKPWASTGPYQRVKPFGDVSGGGGVSGARI